MISPSLGLLAAQVKLVFVRQVHDYHWVLGHTELWTAVDGLLQKREMATSVSPVHVETLNRERVPGSKLECTDN